MNSWAEARRAWTFSHGVARASSLIKDGRRCGGVALSTAALLTGLGGGLVGLEN